MTVLAALADYYERLAARGEASLPPQGYMLELISYAIEIEADGTPLSLQDLRIEAQRGNRESGKAKLVGRPMVVPKHDDHAAGLSPFLFWDNTLYALGVTERTPKNRTPRDYFEAFKSRNLAALGESDDEGAQAFRAFLNRWTPDHFGELAFDEDAVDQNIVFRLRGERRLLHEREAFKSAWESQPPPELAIGQCLVTGTRERVARTHPSLGGVQGAQGAGAALVSFNFGSVESFRKKQGANAPVSERVAFTYTTALNTLLANGARRVRVGDATAIFWADAAGTSEAAAAAAEDVFAAILDPAPDDPDLADFSQMRAAVEAVAEGRGWAKAPALDKRTRMHLLGLSPNNARLAVRFWHVGSFGEFAERMAAHYRDLEIEPARFSKPPKFEAWLYETAVLRKRENIPPLIGGEFIRAILTGARYPRTLLAAVIARICAEGVVNGARAALCKAVVQRGIRKAREEELRLRRERGEDEAIIQRDLREREKKEDIPVSLDKENINAAYRLGRLFALLERAQTLALPGLNATIRDRYFASASAAPQRTFPTLIRNNQHHIASVRKSDKPQLAGWLDKEIGDVWAGLEPDLPRALRLEDQGRFFAGYYHQRFARKDKAGVENPVADDTPDEAGSKED